MNLSSSLNNNNGVSYSRNNNHADNLQNGFSYEFSENLSSRIQNFSMRFSRNLVSDNPHYAFLPRSVHDVYNNNGNDEYFVL
jgi:hypothetical protein